ncbi:acetyltransferase [Filimonas lacunae]|nr:acetyltransferase [Filimonas lacunae]
MLSFGNDRVKYFDLSVSPFVGMRENTAAGFALLNEMAPEDRAFILFASEKVDFPAPWKVTLEMPLFQMVCNNPEAYIQAGEGFIELETEHVSDMLELTKLTNPGPFNSNTIDFGSYTGIYREKQLVAMAGWRMQPRPYIEVSAVCTHPDHLGKGYAGMLIREQMKRIVAQGCLPFLHVKKENSGAIRLYEKLGFGIRSEITAWVFRRMQ